MEAMNDADAVIKLEAGAARGRCRLPLAERIIGHVAELIRRVHGHWPTGGGCVDLLDEEGVP